MHIKTVCNLMLDNPHADGRIEKWGIGRDWPAASHELLHPHCPPALGGPSSWISDGRVEYIAPLQAIAPIGYHSRVSMSLDDWDIRSGQWRETSEAGSFRGAFLQFADGRPRRYAVGAHGWLRSKGDWPLNLMLLTRRYTASQDETEPPVFMIGFAGDGVCPQYALVLPGLAMGGVCWQQLAGRDNALLACPSLLGRPAGETVWSPITDFLYGGAPQAVSGVAETYHVDAVRIECTDGALLINFSSTSRTWSYRGKWLSRGRTQVDFQMAPGPVEVLVMGHTAAFSLLPLVYPDEAVLDAADWFGPPGVFTQTPSYRWIGSRPPGTSLSVSAHPASHDGMAKPRVRFSSSGVARPVLYTIQEYRPAQIGSGESAPVHSQGNDAFRVREASGTLTDRRRGATMRASIEAKTGSELVELKPNGKVSAAVGLEDEAGIAIMHRQFTGYLAPAEYDIRSPGRVRAEIEAADGIDTRLVHKRMLLKPSFAGWPVDEAFHYILNCSGIPDALMSTQADLAARLGVYYHLPLSATSAEPVLKFTPDIGVIEALDTICRVRALEWGVNEDGVYFLRQPVVYEPGAEVWTLDADATADDDFVYSLQAAGSLDEFVNIVFVLTGSTWSARASWLWDSASVLDPTDSAYIGDDWWHVEVLPDADHPELIARHLWDRRQTLRRMLFFSNATRPDLMPGAFIKVQVEGIGVPAGSIFRIVKKDWRCSADGNDFEQVFEAVMILEADT